jgi:predicted alpha/beta superfamily hydrolase
MSMKRLFVLISLGALLAVSGPSIAGPKTKQHRRADYTPAQQQKFFEQSRERCRKKYGGQFDHVEVDYYHWQYVCYIN